MLFTNFKKNSRIKTAKYGGCGEAVNTPGCEPGTRGFKSHHPPQLNNKVLKGTFFVFWGGKKEIKKKSSITKWVIIMNNGFKNEKDIVDLLDKKEISEFPKDIKKEIKYTFKEKKVF